MSPESNFETVEELEAEIDRLFSRDYESPLLGEAPLKVLLYTASVVFAIYHLWYAFTFGIPRTQHGAVHLLFVLPLWGLVQAIDEQESEESRQVVVGGYLLYALVSTGLASYFVLNFNELLSRRGIFTLTDVVIGAFLIGIVFFALIHISRLITAISALGFAYASFGPILPGFLAHGGLSIERIITMNTTEMAGIYGDFLVISATWIVIFLLLAGFIEAFGGMTAMVKGLSKLIAKSKHIEIGQVAVLASMILGSINGSTAANTAITGSFTIPLLKSNNYPPKLAAAIEAVASCGGQILPPVMGAGVFLMASIIDPTYTDIVLAAIIPAFIFFVTVAFSISLFTRRTKAVASLEQEEPQHDSVQGAIKHYLSYFDFIISFALLLYWLIYVQADPMLAGFYSISALVLLRLLKASWKGYQKDHIQATFGKFIRRTVEACRIGVDNTLEITIMVVGLSMVIRAFIVTGLAQAISTELVILAGGNTLLLLVLAMVASIVFGMGMSTTPAYMLVSILVAPALVTSGIAPLVAHLFVFTFAIVSNITPPIALSVVIAQGIAGSSFTATALEALRMGFPMFLLPYVIYAKRAVIYPEASSLPVVFAVILGFLTISVGLVGMLNRKLRLHERLGFVAAGLLSIFMPWVSVQTAVGIVLAVVLYMGYTELNPVKAFTASRFH